MNLPKKIKIKKGRPIKKRTINSTPRVSKYSPRGIRGRPDEVVLRIDQFESIRLADHMGMRHLEASRYMNISRQTFERILKQARRAVACGLVSGKIIRIET